MFGQSLLMATGISGISVALYCAITSKENKDELNPERKMERKTEYVSIFSIILSVSFLLLYMFHRSSEGLVISSESYSHSPAMSSGKPPF